MQITKRHLSVQRRTMLLNVRKRRRRTSAALRNAALQRALSRLHLFAL